MNREIRLQQYVPSIFRGYLEMETIVKVENPEIERLFQGLEERLSDTFLAAATLQGIKRYEALLGIKPSFGSGIEERRVEVLRRWCLTLPYTMKKLLEELNVVAGTEGFELQTRFGQYEMELHIYDQSLGILHSIRKMVQDMIPANLLFIFAGEMQESFMVSILYQNEMTFHSSFYPRCNQAVFFLDGEISLDGNCLLNGYLDEQIVDFYPLQMQAVGEARKKITWSEQIRLWFSTIWAEESVLSLGIQKAAEQQIYFKSNRLYLSGSTFVKKEIKEQMAFQSETEVRLDQEVSFFENGEAKVETDVETNLFLSGGIEEKVSIEEQLIVEKDLWFLDGTYSLDGEKLLDAEIFYYKD